MSPSAGSERKISAVAAVHPPKDRLGMARRPSVPSTSRCTPTCMARTTAGVTRG